ncbi:MAG: Do family serine endopeptidase [Candidatus Polarisedimenticolia bacterium]
MSIALSMSERRTVVLMSLVTLVLGIVLGLAVSSSIGTIGGSGPAAGTAVGAIFQGRAAAQAGPAGQVSPVPSFTEVVKAVVPSVVTVRSQRTVDVPASPFGFLRPWELPGRDEEPPTTRRRLLRGLGSGVVVDARGHILTNNHVVEGSSKVEVILPGGTSTEASIRGADPQTDLAVLEVDSRDLQPIPMGRSADLEVGEWVLAVGNPFAEALAHTVTAGIVSAKGRSNIRLAEIEDFIQTDAAINPGNSGGALVDTSGRLVGINTAIASDNGGFQGIGFAIPIDMARQIMETLIETGKVVRGYLGVVIQDLTPEMSRAGGFKTQEGAIVARVEEGGPGADAGLKTGDVIVAVNDDPVESSAELRNLIASSAPGTRVRLTIERDGKERTLTATLDERPTEDRRGAGRDQSGAEEGLGLAVRDLTPQIAEQLGMRGERGVVVENVEPGSPADEAGLQPGDVIKEVNRRPVTAVSEFRKALEGRGESGISLFLVRRGDETVYVTVQKP